MRVELAQTVVLDCIKKIHEFSEKFPLLRLKDVNLLELGKTWGYAGGEVLAVSMFIEAMHTMNQHSKRNYHIDMNDVKKIQAVKTRNKWVFEVVSLENKKFKITHKSR